MTSKWILLDDENDEQLLCCESVIGLGGEILTKKNDGSDRHTVTFMASRLGARMSSWSTGKKKWSDLEISNCYIGVEISSGSVIGDYFFAAVSPVAGKPNSTVEGVCDIKLKGILNHVPIPEAIVVLTEWSIGLPREKNVWSSYSSNQRRGWLEAALKCSRPNQRAVRGDDEIHLDGSYITDYPGFFCALGEATNGPGGYYGFDLTSMIDCFCGGFGPSRPFSLIWHDSNIARQALTRDKWFEEVQFRRSRGAVFEERCDGHFFDTLLRVFGEHSIRVNLL